jgi:hypothetical protein
MAAKFLPFQSLKFYKFLNKYCLTFSPLPEDDEDRTKRPSFPTSPTKSVTPTSSPTKPPTSSKLEEHPITRQTISLPAAERLIGSSASAGAVVTARSGFEKKFSVHWKQLNVITLVLKENDNINQIITRTRFLYSNLFLKLSHWCLSNLITKRALMI